MLTDQFPEPSSTVQAEKEIAREKGEFDAAVRVVEEVEKKIQRLGFSQEAHTGK
jgi:hypothetical protein